MVPPNVIDQHAYLTPKSQLRRVLSKFNLTNSTLVEIMAKLLTQPHSRQPDGVIINSQGHEPFD
jgi:hypothetical protein